VRGILADKNGKILGQGFVLDAALDADASSLNPSSDKNNNTFGTSTVSDPDLDKLKGN
jgi:hypothetical protein